MRPALPCSCRDMGWLFLILVAFVVICLSVDWAIWTNRKKD